MSTRVASLALLLSAAPALADHFATSVVTYSPGTNPVPGYTSPIAAIGEPTRFTGQGVFPSAVTPFNPPFLSSEIVSIGEGGSIVLAFDHPVLNDPANPFGIDLLIFGNAFYADASYPQGIAAAVISAGGGIVEVSADLDTWIAIPGAAAESQFPTLGYADLTDPYALDPGSVHTDFTRPVDPSFNPIGLTFAQIVAGYNGSGGGSGIDIGLAGVSAISYLRITNPIGSGVTVEIDAVAEVVPSPGPVISMLGFGGLAAVRRRR